MWAKRVFVDQTVTITSDVIHESLRGIKSQLHSKRWILLSHKTKCKKIDFNYYALGADMAREVLKLERIVLEMQIYELKAKINEQISILQKQYYGK